MANRHKDIHKAMEFNAPGGLSSIGPDECVTNEAYFVDFVKFSMESHVSYGLK